MSRSSEERINGMQDLKLEAVDLDAWMRQALEVAVLEAEDEAERRSFLISLGEVAAAQELGIEIRSEDVG